MKATRRQTAYLEAVRIHMEAQFITAATFKSCGCITADWAGVVRTVTCDACAQRKELLERMNRDIPRSCYCGQVDEWCEDTHRAFSAGKYETAEKLREQRMAHRCEPRDIEDAKRWPEQVKGHIQGSCPD